MSRRNLALAAVAGLALFAAGVLSAYFFGVARPPAAPSAAEATSRAGAGPKAREPRLILDRDKIELLPDASLHLDLPPGFDAGP